MSAPKTIRVTAEHIEQGERQNAQACPIALAVYEQLHLSRRLDDVLVDQGSIYVCRDAGGEIRADVPDEAWLFVEHFDDGEPVEPFEFAVEFTDQDGVSV